MRTGRPKKYQDITKEDLIELYCNQELSIPQIAEMKDMPTNSLGHYLHRFNIPARGCADYHRIAIKHNRMMGKQLSLSHQELSDLYWVDKLSIAEIARKTGCSNHRIQYSLETWRIPRRSSREAIQLQYNTGKRIRRGKFQSSRDGYIHILNPEHHRATKAGWVVEHILVWEQANNQSLPKGWVVHHLNGIRSDNRPENLLGMFRKDHNSQLQLNTMRKRIRELETKLGY